MLGDLPHFQGALVEQAAGLDIVRSLRVGDGDNGAVTADPDRMVRVRVAAEDYLDAAGAQYVARTPVEAYLRLSESIDLHRVDPTAILPPTVVVAVEGDRLVPLADLVGLVEGLGPRGSLRVLRSPYGHDAFLKETDRIDAILATAFRTSGESA